MNRISCTTEVLKDVFFFEYEEFLSNCDVVYSAPILFTWAGSFSVHFGGISLIQKLSSRTYVGVRKNGLGKIQYKHFRTFAPSKKRFIDVSIEYFLEIKGLKKLEVFLKERFPNHYFGEGYDIFILSENDWIDTCPIYTSLLLAILTDLGIITEEDIQKYFGVIDSFSEDQRFDDLFRLLWKMFLQVENETTLSACGGEIANCLISSKLPLIYQTEERVGGGGYDLLTRQPHYIDYDNCDIVDNIKYKISILDQYISSEYVFPIRFGIIYPGQRKMFEFRDYCDDMKHQADIMNGHLHNFGELLLTQNKGDSIFLDSITQPAYLVKNILGVVEYYSMNIVIAFIEEILKGQNTRLFIASLKEYKRVFNTVYDKSPWSSENIFEQEIKNYLSKIAMSENSFFLQEKAIEGDAKLLYVVSKKSFPYFYEDFVSADFYKEGVVSLDYDSHLDGIGTEGARLEMFREKKYFSHWLTNYAKHAWVNNYKEKRLVGEDETLDQFDVLLHLPKEKMFIKGKKLNTNDITSQSYTIQVLTKLMETPGGKVASRDLPLSAYSVSKVDFIHKIIRPFQTSLDKYLGDGHGISLECEGSLTEFRVTLHNPNYKIWLFNEPNFK